MSKVLALKYRPKNFDQLIGQDSIRITLTSALESKRLSNAYLFSGLRGSGKTSTARIFSKALLCDEGPTPYPCEKCENCKAANEGRHIDIIEMDAASNRKIDDIRHVIEQTKYKPSIGRFKIFIIDEVHMLTKEAFNALLKTLEEPPEYVKFILATTDPMKLPATILSRTQHFRFKKIAQSDILHHIEHILELENIEYEEDALKIIARSADGSLRDTLTLLDQAIIYSNGFIDVKSVTAMLGLLDPKVFDDLIEIILNKDKEALKQKIKELESFEIEIVIEEFISFLKESFLKEDVRFNLLLIERFFRILAQAKNLLQFNSDNVFVLTLAFFKMIEATKLKEIDLLIEESEKKIFSQNKPLLNNSSNIQETLPNKEITNENKNEKKDKLLNNSSFENQKKFEKLKELLYDRNYELGECFEKNIEFLSFENNILNLTSSAKDQCKELLRKSSAIIKYFVKEVFSIDTKISISSVKKNNAQQNSDNDVKNIEKNEKEEEKTNGSCMEENLSLKTNEIDPENILENPFVKKAKELFEPQKIIIKSKV